MKLEALLKCSADELEKMTDAELEQHFSPFFVLTRPDPSATAAKKKAQSAKGEEDALSMTKDLIRRKQGKQPIISYEKQMKLKQLGFDIGDSFK